MLKNQQLNLEKRGSGEEEKWACRFLLYAFLSHLSFKVYECVICSINK